MVWRSLFAGKSIYMINLKPFRQSPSFCGPASLKMVLEYYGVEKTEKELGELCKTTFEHGTEHDNLVRAAEMLDFQVQQKPNASLEELKQLVDQGIPVIVGWFSTDEDHFSVVVEITDTDIHLMDPEVDQGHRKMTVSEFEAVWYDNDGPENKRFVHWMMWINSSKQ